MKNTIILVIIGLILSCCKDQTLLKAENEKSVEFNQELADELKDMAEIDQIAAYVPQGKYKEMTREEWNAFKDSVFTTHQKRLKEIFDKHGFVGFDLAGKEGSSNFWVMVQHSDHNPDFQQEVLENMKIKVDNGNADPGNYGLLVDRVNLNTGKAQIYGTQTEFNFEIAQSFPKTLVDSANVNKRRKSLGMEPLEVYLNDMTLLNFEVNKDILLKKGITEPKLYNIE